MTDTNIHNLIVDNSATGMSSKDVDGAKEENECVAEHGWKPTNF
jgi:hypothetical protein